MGANWTQLRPPAPTFSENDFPALNGRVFIVTGGNAGIGLELAKILYRKGGTVYITGRSPEKIAAEIENIKSLPTETPGQLKSLHVDLNDLTTISKCVSAFLAQESRLDVLFNNAGISRMPPGSTNVQGHESCMGTNCLGPHLLTKLLMPMLTQTARTAPKDSVRVVFTSSGIVDLGAPPGGLVLEELKPGNHSNNMNHNYACSKVGNWFLASEFDKRVRKDGVVCLTQNPGNYNTQIWNRVPWLMRVLLWPVFYDPKLGGLTEFWAGLSPEVTGEDGGRYAIPFGRWHPSPKPDILASMKTEEEGGTGVADKFWTWCEQETKPYI